MKTFKTFIAEEAQAEPFHAVKEVPAKKSLLDVHMKLATAGGGIYGKSKMGTEIPDREMKHVQVNLGKQKYKGWGESFSNLKDTGLGEKTIKAHEGHIAKINSRLADTNEAPMQVKQVHMLYDPHRVIIHMNNGTHDMGMTYHEGKSSGSGLRNFITTDGTKVGASKFPHSDIHTGEIHLEGTLSEAKRLILSPEYGSVNKYNSHDHANKLIRLGDNRVHRVVWDKFKHIHDTQGWRAGMGIPINLYNHTSDHGIKQEIKTYFPHIRG